MAKKTVKKPDNKKFAGILVAVGIIGVGVIGYAMTHGGPKVMIVDPATLAGAAEGHLMGKADAPVQVIEFGDFECPGCGNFANLTEPDVRSRLIAQGIVGFRYYDFPLPGHKNTWTAHLSASCAEEQGKFWEMHDRIYAGQDEWSDLTAGIKNPLAVFRRYANELGLDVKKWEDCVVTQRPAARLKGNQAEGVRRNVGSTPTLIIGNQQVNSVTYDDFKKLVDKALLEVTKAKADSAKKPAAGKKGA